MLKLIAFWAGFYRQRIYFGKTLFHFETHGTLQKPADILFINQRSDFNLSSLFWKTRVFWLKAPDLEPLKFQFPQSVSLVYHVKIPRGYSDIYTEIEFVFRNSGLFTFLPSKVLLFIRSQQGKMLFFIQNRSECQHLIHRFYAQEWGCCCFS